MKALLIRCMFFTLGSVTAWAQRIETRSPDPNQIIHVKMAMNHLTVIELGQPARSIQPRVGAPDVEANLAPAEMERRGKAVLNR